jgi:LAO/AO transport system kinase
MSRTYFGVSIRWRRMKRSSVSGPPWSRAGAGRNPKGGPDGGGPRSSLSSGARVSTGAILCAARPPVPFAPVPEPGSTAAELAERLLAGDKRALARAISLVENDDPEGWELVRAVYPSTGRAAIVGFTGPPGVGKSTLIGAIVRNARERERDVAVLSIDPSSPFTKGALLGDRIRLADHFLDPGVFIRSMASRGSLGGLSEATLQAALLMDASGKDEVLLETVGVGQAEVDIIDHADTVVLVLMPGSGDSIQALKAGVMEIPDVIVVNKADHPLTDTMVREIRGVLSLGPSTSWRVPILRTEAARGEGVDELVEKIGEHRRHIEEEGTLEERRRRNLMNEVMELAAVRMRRRLDAAVEGDAEVQALLDEVVARRLDPASAAAKLLERETS